MRAGEYLFFTCSAGFAVIATLVIVIVALRGRMVAADIDAAMEQGE